MLIETAFSISIQHSTISIFSASMRPHPHLLEIAAWPWLERLSREEGRLVTLADVPDVHWDRSHDAASTAYF